MNIAILTYPGHFFMTKLCLDSVRKFYQGNIHILLDDCEVTEWPNYVEDVKQYYGDDITYHLYSTLMEPYRDWIRWGWWRQQFVKLHIDTYINSDEIFIVDGDVIFDQKLDIRIQPIYNQGQFPKSDIDSMCDNYVRYMLGIPNGHLTNSTGFVRTSQTPWRLVTRTVLQGLRKHVEALHGENFLGLHNRLIKSQDIAGQDPDKMSISEWELIEAYRTFILKDTFPQCPWGGGWDIKQGLFDSFRHTSETDDLIGRDWLQQHCEISDDHWNKSQHWLSNRKW